MEFERLKNRITPEQADIKVSYRLKPGYAIVHLSHNLLKRIGWGKECRAYVSIEKNDNKVWMIEKTDCLLDSHKISHYGRIVNYSILQIRCRDAPVDREERRIKPVDFVTERSIIGNTSKIIIYNR